MNEIRRSAVEITLESFESCVVTANKKIETSFVSMGISGEALNGVSTTGTSFGVVGSADYEYLDKTMFLNSYLICISNTDLHTKTFGLDNQNGFELYRQICQLVGSIPEDAAFHLSNELGNLTSLHGGKVKDLRTLYGFRLLLKRKVA